MDCREWLFKRPGASHSGQEEAGGCKYAAFPNTSALTISYKNNVRFKYEC